MRALPFACVRAGDSVEKAATAADVERLVDAGTYLRDGSPSLFIWQVFSDTAGARQGLLCTCSIAEFIGATSGVEADPDVPNHLLPLGYQDAPVALVRPNAPVLAMILGNATTGTPLYQFQLGDEAHTIWALKRGETLEALCELLERLENVKVAEPAHLAGIVSAARTLRDQAKAAGTYTGREPFNWFTAALFTEAALAAGIPRLPANLILRPFGVKE